MQTTISDHPPKRKPVERLVWESALPRHQKDILSCLLSFGRNGRGMFPGHKQLADNVGVVESTIIRNLNSLCQSGVLVRVCERKKGDWEQRRALSPPERGPGRGWVIEYVLVDERLPLKGRIQHAEKVASSDVKGRIQHAEKVASSDPASLFNDLKERSVQRDLGGDQGPLPRPTPQRAELRRRGKEKAFTGRRIYVMDDQYPELLARVGGPETEREQRLIRIFHSIDNDVGNSDIPNMPRFIRQQIERHLKGPPDAPMNLHNLDVLTDFVAHAKEAINE